MQELLPFHPDNPTTRALLVQLITGHKLADLPENLRDRIADRCSQTCKNYISEFLLIHFGKESYLEFEKLLAHDYNQMFDQQELISQIRQAYSSFIDLVKNSYYTP